MNLGTLFCRECIPDISTGEYSLWLGLAIIATVIALRNCYRCFKRARLIEDMPTAKVRSASQGFTELIGIAHLEHQPLSSPLTATPCLWWSFQIEKYQSSGKSHHWVTVEKKHSEVPFYLRDTTGICRIEPRGAEITAKHRKVWYGNSRQPTSNEKSGGRFSMGGLTIGRRYRYTEILIREGDPLYTLGHFETDKGGQRSASPQAIAGDILRHWKQDFGKLLDQFDHNGDGELDMQEWQQVQKAAYQAALAEQNKSAALPHQHSLSKPSDSGLPFIIGTKEQASLVRKFQWQAVAYAGGFLAAGTLTTWLINARLIS